MNAFIHGRRCLAKRAIVAGLRGPYGDHRGWGVIVVWAADIAAALTHGDSAATIGSTADRPP
ncbi:MAG TPA: hypothetical protein VIR00_04590, partial [Micromonosporaceae bacterium]